MKRVVIIGAGGHGREVADVVHCMKRDGARMELVGFIDDDPGKWGRSLSGAEVVGDWSWFDRKEADGVQVINAIGSPKTARRLIRRAEERRLSFATITSPFAYVSPAASIGQGVSVLAGAVIQPDVVIGDHCIVNVGATVSHDSVIGPYARLNPGAHIAGGVTVGEGACVGMGADVIQCTVVGAWSTVGAGSVVLREVPSHVTVVGVPARIVKRHDPADCA